MTRKSPPVAAGNCTMAARSSATFCVATAARLGAEVPAPASGTLNTKYVLAAAPDGSVAVTSTRTSVKPLTAAVTA